jgi:hypothetical protein
MFCAKRAAPKGRPGAATACGKSCGQASVPINGMSRSPRKGETVSHEKADAAPHRGSCKQAGQELTIGIDLGDVWSHYCTLNQDGEVVDWGRIRTTSKVIEKWFKDLPSTRVAMEAAVHSIGSANSAMK